MDSYQYFGIIFSVKNNNDFFFSLNPFNTILEDLNYIFYLNNGLDFNLCITNISNCIIYIVSTKNQWNSKKNIKSFEELKNNYKILDTIEIDIDKYINKKNIIIKKEHIEYNFNVNKIQHLEFYTEPLIKINKDYINQSLGSIANS